MHVIEVIAPGMLTTIQDLGRDGFAAIGVCVGGAADPLSLRIGNRLVGNPDSAAAIEMTLLGGAFRFESAATVALAGAEIDATVERAGGLKRPLVAWSAARVEAGEIVRTGPMPRGARSYLCISGGVRVDTVMGSASTHLAGGFGGFRGRALRKGDKITLGEPSSGAAGKTDMARALGQDTLQRRSLRATLGPHAGLFAEDAVAKFWGSEFATSNRSDRAGLRLTSTAQSPIRARDQGSLTSEGMAWGCVQVPPGGEPIVLMVDLPTTGGYPVIACVASVDLPALGQLRPGDIIRFERVAPDEARRLYMEREQRLNREIPPA